MRTRVLRVLSALVLALAGAHCSGGGGSESSPLRSYMILGTGNRLPVDLEESVEAADGILDRTFHQIGIAEASSTSPRFAAEVESHSGVRLVLPNPMVQWMDPGTPWAASGAYVPNPPTSGDDDAVFDMQWGLDAIDAPEAWALGERGAGVRVAVVDSGISSSHADLAPNLNMALATSFVPGEHVDIDTLPSPPTFNHGSWVAGIVGAADNGTGMIGVAPEAEIVPIRVLSNWGGAAPSWVIAGILYAADIDADVINLSLVFMARHRGSFAFATAREAAGLWTAFARATNYAHHKGCTIIAAAGNFAWDEDHDADLFIVPSHSPHAISISATSPIGWALNPTTDLDIPTGYTHYGQSVIAFAAPGGSGLSPYPVTYCTLGSYTRPCYLFDWVVGPSSTGGWVWASGTSAAAPHVAGVAALIIGKNGGEMHPDHVYAALRSSADDLGKPGMDDHYGHGRVNAFRAVQ